MKRYILFAAAFLALASCAKDNIKEVNKGQVIDFHTTMTRAAVTTTDNLQDIWVTATNEGETNYYSDLQYTRDAGYFKSETSYYWPADGSTLNFYAYAPAQSSLGTISIDKNSQTMTGFAPASDISNQVDFIVATATGSKDNADTGVELIFDHALTQVTVNALNSNTGYVYKVKGVRISQVASAGDYDFSTKSWTPSTEKTSYEVLYDSERILGTEAISLMASEEDNAMLIPQKLTPWDTEDKTNVNGGAFIAVLVNIMAEETQVYPAKDGEYDWIATPIDTEWIRGIKYTYNLDLKEGGLVAPDKIEEETDPFKPGEEVLGGVVKFTLNTSYMYWNSANSNDLTM